MREQPHYYEIRVRNHLNVRWSTRFEGMTITNIENGEALISGRIIDQSALYGLLGRIQDLNLQLISIREITDNSNPLD